MCGGWWATNGERLASRVESIPAHVGAHLLVRGRLVVGPNGVPAVKAFANDVEFAPSPTEIAPTSPPAGYSPPAAGYPPMMSELNLNLKQMINVDNYSVFIMEMYIVYSRFLLIVT